MDPLSIIASIVGIATTGAALSKTIYEFISSTRGASREMRQIARAIADLSIILGELHRVLRESAELYNRKFLRRIKSATKRISRIHGEIHKLMDGARGLTAFTWMLKRSEVHHKLVQIESHKTGVNLMLNILVLAVATRKQAKPSRPQVQRGDQQNDGQDQKNDISLLRQQAENLAFAAHQSLVDLSESQAECITDSEQPNGTDSDDKSETTSQLQVQVYKKKSDDTNDWIFDLVFLSYAQSCADPSNQESAGLSSNSTVPEIDEDAQGLSSKNERSTGKMAMIRDPSEIQIALYNPGAASSLVRELLADWTVLTEKEIESVTDDSQGSKQKEEKTSNESQEVKEIVYFTDAVGRKFTFPFHRVKEYEVSRNLLTCKTMSCLLYRA
ncbi:hypothetical protein BKA56DRAFT_499202 [Ilyonectria sp. MPI-CAGE-AT-0026]|nr:hypothetical protein BKA56DRAFT_499202 [Ilyonectria sp. MPI-CAGE-AT-0026]